MLPLIDRGGAGMLPPHCQPALDDVCAHLCGRSDLWAAEQLEGRRGLSCRTPHQRGPAACPSSTARALAAALQRCVPTTRAPSHLCVASRSTAGSAASSRVAFAFLVRDGADYLARNLNALADLGASFGGWRLFYVENDSSDSSRRILRRFGARHEQASGLMLDRLSALPSASLCPPVASELNCRARVSLLASLRQRLLTLALDGVRAWGARDALLMLDIDFVAFSKSNYLRGFELASRGRAAALFASSVFKNKFGHLNLYDTGAVEPPRLRSQLRDVPACLVPASSGFGGFGTYWLEGLRTAAPNYSASAAAYRGKIEHLGFNRQLRLGLPRRAAGPDVPRASPAVAAEDASANASAGSPLGIYIDPAFRPSYLYGSGAISWDRVRVGRASQADGGRSAAVGAAGTRQAAEATASAGAATAATTLSIVVPARNDNWGAPSTGGLVRRAAVALGRMLEVADEVVLVDVNSIGPPLLSALPSTIRDAPNLVSLVINASDCAARRSARLRRNASCGSRFYETMGRNAGVRLARSDAIASSNLDVLPPSRAVLDRLLVHMATAHIGDAPSPRNASPAAHGPAPSLGARALNAYILRRKEYTAWDDAEERAAAAAPPPQTWCPPTTLCHRRVRDAFGPKVRATLSDLDGLHPNAVRPSASHLRLGEIETLPARPERAMATLSLVSNCGDFQLAHRELWAAAPFSERLEGRQYADTSLHVAWLNQHATLHVPSGAWVLHASHVHPHQRREPALWKAVQWNQMPHFVVAGGGGAIRDRLGLV